MSRVCARGEAFRGWSGKKAVEGVEKSCSTGCKSRRRRVRGQRKGSKRSRVGKTRSNSPLPAPEPKISRQRHVVHSGRKFIYMIKAVNHLSKQMKEHGKGRPVKGDVRFEDGLRHWNTLARKSHVMKIPPGASEHPGRTFTGFLEAVFPSGQAIDDFGSMLGLMRSRGMSAQHRRGSSTHTQGNEIPVRTVPGRPEVRIIIVDGKDEPLCPHCRDFRLEKKRGVLGPPRRFCNINDPLCHLWSESDTKPKASLRGSNAKRGTGGRPKSRR
jgi:hypothetical protein